GSVGELLDRRGDEGEAVVVQPVDQRAQGGILLIVQHGGVVEGTQQACAAGEEVVEALVIDVEVQALGGRMEVGTVNEERDALLRVEMHAKILVVRMRLKCRLVHTKSGRLPLIAA